MKIILKHLVNGNMKASDVCVFQKCASLHISLLFNWSRLGHFLSFVVKAANYDLSHSSWKPMWEVANRSIYSTYPNESKKQPGTVNLMNEFVCLTKYVNYFEAGSGSKLSLSDRKGYKFEPWQCRHYYEQFHSLATLSVQTFYIAQRLQQREVLTLYLILFSKSLCIKKNN